MTAPMPARNGRTAPQSGDGASAANAAAPARSGALRVQDRLERLRAERGETIRLDEVVGVVEELLASLEGDLGLGDLTLHRELNALAEYISHAKSEIASIAPGEIPAHHIPLATDELDAVVRATEEATGIILDAAEQMSALADELDSAQGQRLRALATSIYEASNFQDITGQRVTKVVRTLRFIEAKVVALAHAFGEEIMASPEAMRLSAEVAADEKALLNGPQLPHKANTQDEIDALLASFD